MKSVEENESVSNPFSKGMMKGRIFTFGYISERPFLLEGEFGPFIQIKIHIYGIEKKNGENPPKSPKKGRTRRG